MSYGPYRYQNGNKYVFGSDGRWWLVSYSRGGDDYGYPVSIHTHGYHSRHHASNPPALPAHAHLHHQAHFPAHRVGTAGPEDPWQGNTYARELFQGRGAATFIGADHLVTNVVEIYTIAYTAAFFMPELLTALDYTASRTISPLARWTLNQTGAFGPLVNRLFWSGFGTGSAAAIRYGSQIGGYVGHTLEESPLGSFADSLQMYLPQNRLTGFVWEWLSTSYAEGAQGTATYFEGLDRLGLPYQGQVWLETEYPILVQRGVIVVQILQSR